MKQDKTRLTNYQHNPSLDGHSQLRTMAYGWKHDVNGWRLVTFFSRKDAIFDERL